MKVLHAPGSRSLRVLWACEEMGIAIDTEAASFMAPTPEFTRLNPSRTLPVMVDDEVVLTESIAILLYLASRYGPTPLALGPDEAAYPDFLQFLIFGEAGLSAPLNAMIGTKFMAPEGQKENFTTGAIIEGFRRRCMLVEQRLEGREFLAADRFTLADISVTYALGLAANVLGLGEQTPASVRAYYERMTARPAYQQAAAR